MTDANNIFRLNNVEFDIESATLLAGVYPLPDEDTSEFIWILDVNMARRELNGQNCRPRLYHEEIVLPARRLEDLAGQTLFLNMEEEYPEYALYVFQHCAIYGSHLRFIDVDGRNVRIEWRGLSDARGPDTPFYMHARAEFKEIQVKGNENDTEETMRARLEEHFDTADYMVRLMEVSKDVGPDGLRDAYCYFTHR